MAFKKNDSVLMTGQVLRKNPDTGAPQTLNLADEPGTIEKLRVFKGDETKNTYWVKTQYGVHVSHESKLKIKPVA